MSRSRVNKSIRAVAWDTLAELGEWKVSDDEVNARVGISACRSLSDVELSLHRILIHPSQTSILVLGQLQIEKERLVNELVQLRGRATFAEEGMNQRNREAQQLRDEVQKWASATEYFKAYR